MDRCFVIQPFDEKYNQRFDEIFAPAINEAGLEWYRVDKDFGVRIPIESIEKGIRESQICFADISTNNPNVWYELGFAFACNKDVVMVCSEDERKDGFPFDIRHRQIILYKNNSVSDFQKLKTAIVQKLILLSSLNNKKFIRSAGDSEWLATTNRSTPQWTAYEELLHNYILKTFSCSIRSKSDYFRFGVKLTESTGKPFGDAVIKSFDNNLIIHLGKNYDAPDLFMTVQKNGIRQDKNKSLFDFKKNEWIDLKIDVSSENKLRVYINSDLAFETTIQNAIRKRLFMLAWGDHNDYEVSVKNIKVIAAE